MQILNSISTIGSTLKEARSEDDQNLQTAENKRELTAVIYVVYCFVLDHSTTHTYSGVNCHFTHGQNSFPKHLH